MSPAMIQKKRREDFSKWFFFLCWQRCDDGFRIFGLGLNFFFRVRVVVSWWKTSITTCIIDDWTRWTRKHLERRKKNEYQDCLATEKLQKQVVFKRVLWPMFTMYFSLCSLIIHWKIIQQIFYYKHTFVIYNTDLLTGTGRRQLFCHTRKRRKEKKKAATRGCFMKYISCDTHRKFHEVWTTDKVMFFLFSVCFAEYFYRFALTPSGKIRKWIFELSAQQTTKSTHFFHFFLLLYNLSLCSTVSTTMSIGKN